MDTGPALDARSPPEAVPLLKKTRVANSAVLPLAARPPYAAADAQDLIGADPQRAMADDDQAILETQRRLKRFKPEAGDSQGASAIASEAQPDRVLPGSADALAGLIQDLSAPTLPFAEPKPIISPLSSLPIAMLAAIMVRRADMLLQLGDVSGARLLYERAAAAGSGGAAMTMGKTFDATFLAGIGVTSMGADPAMAMSWYRRAAGLGSAEARTRLQASMPATSGISSP